jgi:hypothetical protein
MLLNDIYTQLRYDNVVRNAYQFSTQFLNKNESYYSVLKTREQEPSIATLIYLEKELIETAAFYKKYNYPHFNRTYNHLLPLIERVRNHNKAITQLNILRKKVLF